MSNFFVPPIDESLQLTDNSKAIVSGLNTEAVNLNASNESLVIPVGITSTQISRYQIPAKYLDEQILNDIQSSVSQINEKKKQIVDLCSIVVSSFIPGLSSPICSLESNLDNLDSPIISDTGIIPASIGIGIGIGTPTPQIAYGNVRDDALRVYLAPYLEQRIAPNENALEGLKYPILTEEIFGQGKENLIFENAKYSEDGFDIYAWNDQGDWGTETWEGTGNVIGRYYKITGSGSPLRVPGTVNKVTNIFTPDEDWEPLLENLSGFYETVTGYISQLEMFGLIGIAITTSVTLNLKTRTLQPATNTLITGSASFTADALSSCTELANQIEVLENEVVSLRNSLQNNQNLISVNILKNNKHNEQLNMWTYKRIEVTNNEEIVQIGISTETIDTIDPELPVEFKTFDDNVLSKFDNNSLTFDSY